VIGGTCGLTACGRNPHGVSFREPDECCGVLFHTIKGVNGG
jgi:hypothetical protein